MKTVKIAFKSYEGDGLPPGYKDIYCYTIFGVNLGEKIQVGCRWSPYIITGINNIFLCVLLVFSHYMFVNIYI